MRTIKKETLAAAFITCLLLSLQVFADEGSCPGAGGCAPCGVAAMDAGNIPSYAPGVNPIINYTATAEDTRCRGYFGGFYLGAGYGLGNVNYHLQINGVTPSSQVVLIPPPTISGLDSDSRRYLVTIFNAGFNLVLDYFFLGTEVGYNYRSRINPSSYYDLGSQIFRVSTVDDVRTALDTHPCKIHLDINSQHAVTADLLPGVVIQRFVAYLRLGVEQANYTWKRRVCMPLITANELVDPILITVTDGDFVDSRSKTATGYRLGAGFGVAAGPHVSLYLNYIHTFTNKITFTPDVSPMLASAPVIINGGPVAPFEALIQNLAANNDVEPQRDEVNLGVKFRF